MKIVFFGTADFGIPALTAIIDNGHTVSAVVTNPPKPAGRGLKLRKSPIHQFCEDNDISTVIIPDNLDENLSITLKEFGADIFVVVAFSILPEVIFSIPPKGTYNIHAALLPKFRGPAPIQRAIEIGANKSGVTFFRIDKGIDTGNIVLQKSVEIKSTDTTPSLYEKLSNLGADVAVESIKLIESNRVEYREQDGSKATRAPLLKKSEALINFNDSAEIIANRVRAFMPFPGTYTIINGKQTSIVEAHFTKESSSCSVGTVLECNREGISIATANGVLIIKELKPSGKRAMKVRDYLNGSDLKEGMIIG